MNLLKEVAVLGAREFVVLKFLLCILIVFIE